MNPLHNALHDFKRCADQAPEGLYEDAKALNEVIGDTCDNLMGELRRLGLKADNCDLIFEVEAAIYNYVKGSNPERSSLVTAEAFGAHLASPSRERVMGNALRDRDFLRGIGALPH